MGDGDGARKLLQDCEGAPLSGVHQGILHPWLGEERRALEIFARGVRRGEADTFALHRAMLPFFRDPDLRSACDALLRPSAPGRSARAADA